jgi:hypothetical protein
MKLTTQYGPMVANATTAHRAAANDTLEDVKARQAVRTGRLRDSEHLVERVLSSGSTTRSTIVSSVVYADAVERGANAREKASVRKGTKRRKGTFGPVLNRATRRGPHMAGNHVVADNGPHFLEHMDRRMRERAL